MKVSELYKWFQDFFGNIAQKSFPKSFSAPTPPTPTRNSPYPPQPNTPTPTPTYNPPPVPIPGTFPNVYPPPNPNAPTQSPAPIPIPQIPLTPRVNTPPPLPPPIPTNDDSRKWANILGKIGDGKNYDEGDILRRLARSHRLDFLKQKAESRHATPEEKEDYSVARKKNTWQATKKIGESLHKGMTTDDPYEMQKQVGSGLQGLGKMIGGRAGRVLEGYGKMVEISAKVQEAMTKFGDNLIEVNTKFAEFSSSMTRVQVMKEMADMRLSQSKGEARAESAKLLTEEKIKFDKGWAIVENTFAIMANQTAAALYRFGNFVMGNNNSNTDPNPGFGQELGNAARTDWTEVYGQPQNFQRLP